MVSLQIESSPCSLQLDSQMSAPTSVSEHIWRQRDLVMWVFVSQAAMHSVISRPVAPRTAVPPMLVGMAPEFVAVSGRPLAPVLG